ncbi:unnamed protein product [Menidia menidia]|uniref:(Atlantic silverside) hypothetical protein n=1 Tax=Menidia menidia TaxID=238744 RepID=A0A8S4AEX2_9TELE|nr:unnamed protein product [Menidia menidia]
MGDAQSAQRDDKRDAAAEEESGKVDDVQTEQSVDEKPLKNNGQIAEISRKSDSSIAALNGHCEDEIAAEVLSPDKDVSESLKEEETALKKELSDETDANEVGAVELIEMEAKQNDINESFRKFFSNISLKLTVKRGSTDVERQGPEEEANKPEDSKDTISEITFENDEQNIDISPPQEPHDNDSTTYQTVTDGTLEDLNEKTEEKATETKDEVASDDADGETTSPVTEDMHQDATPEEEPILQSPSLPDGKEIATQFKKFFTSGIFSGIRKKKKSVEEELSEKELEDMGKKVTVERTDQSVEDQKQQTTEISAGLEGAKAERELDEKELDESLLKAESAQAVDDMKSLNEAGNEQENKVQASPLKRLLSGSSLKKLSKKQRSRRSSDAKLSDSGDHISDQLTSSTESTENQKEETPAQTSTEPAPEDEGAWASFKKLLTPQKHMKRSSLSQEEGKIPSSEAGAKTAEGEQISDHSTEEGKKRKDSTVSWEAVLCGSGKRRSRKTSDSEDETPQADLEDTKQGSGLEAEPVGTSNQVLASSPKQTEGPTEDEEGSTWKSFKKLVTPKRKVKDEDESKDNIHDTDREVAQDDSPFSIKKLLPGRKKRKSAEKQDQVSLNEADKEEVSADEDSETPAVVPLSEFDMDEAAVHVETQPDIDSHEPQEAELEQDLVDEMTEQVMPPDVPSSEVKEIPESEKAVESEVPVSPVSNEEPEDLTDLLSKQLSDIPEEGVITETSLASVAEEIARDDTLAEDLIEITSEAITAPEPVDTTLADETAEMISAVSQLSDSSKTSGNTTPVPAEYSVMTTEVLLQQVSESMAITPNTIPLCLEEPAPERMALSVSDQMLGLSDVNQPKVLELHRESDVATIKMGLKAEAIDAVDEFAATAQTECVSHLNKVIPTEIVSEVPKKEFHNAEPVADKVYEVNISESQESIQEFQVSDDSQQAEESIEENKAVSADQLLQKDEKVALLEVDVGLDQAEPEMPKTPPEEGDLVVISAEETEEVAEKEEVQSVVEEAVDRTENVFQEPQTEGVAPALADDLQALTGEEMEECYVKYAEVPSSDDIPPPVTDTDEPKREVEPLSEVTDETEKTELQTGETDQSEMRVSEVTEVEETCEDHKVFDATELQVSDAAEVSKTSEVQDISEVSELAAFSEMREVSEETEVMEDVEATPLQSDITSVQLFEKEVVSEDVPLSSEKVEEEAKKQSESPSEMNAVSEDSPITEDVQEEEAKGEEGVVLPTLAGKSESLEVITDDTATVETVPTEPKETLELHIEPEEELQPEASTTDFKDVTSETETDTETTNPPCEAEQSAEESGAQELERQTLVEDAPQPEESDSVPEETERPVTPKLDQISEIYNNEEVESIPQDAQVEQEDTQELQTSIAVHISSVTEEQSSATVLEKTICTEDPAPSVDNIEVSSEPVFHLSVCGVQQTAEEENAGVIPVPGLKTAATDHTFVTQMVTSNIKDISAEKPHVLVHEPLTSRVVTETEFNDAVETTTPLLKKDVTEIAEKGNVVVLMHVPTVEFEENHRFQVQVMDVDIRSAQNVVDTVIEVGVTEAKEIIDVCHETICEVENLSATPDIEEEIAQEDIKVTVQEVIQHHENIITETIPCSDVVNLEQEAIRQSDPVADMARSESSEAELIQESTETVMEILDEEPAAITEHSLIPTDQQEPDVQKQISDSPESLVGSVQEHEEDLDETKAELEKPKICDRAEDAAAEQLAVKKLSEQIMETQRLQTAQDQIVTHSNAGLAVPQNTGVISSIGNVESPSSLSLEFKLNIQFGQAKGPAPPPPPIERTEPIKQVDMFEVGVQAEEAVEPPPPTNLTQKVETVKPPELNEVAVQATGLPEADADLWSIKQAEIACLPMQQDISVQVMETIEPVEQSETTERVSPQVQVAEAIQPARQRERRAVHLSKPPPSLTKAEENVKETEEENDHDVWLDAEEDIYTQEETQSSTQAVEEEEEEDPVELPAESELKEQEEVEDQFEMVCNPEGEDNEVKQELHKALITCDFESEGEDFAVALEDLEETRVAAQDLD